MHSPYLYFADGRLSVAELSAARLDGHVVELGEGYIPADAIETAHLRAASLAVLLGASLAATHASAAWVHGALAEPPTRHSAQRAVPRRVHVPIHRRFTYRDGWLEPGDLVVFAGVHVTTPERTLADLARLATTDAGSADAASALGAQHPGLADAALAWFATHGPVPGKRAAQRWLAALAQVEASSSVYDEVTRYTS